MGGNRVSHDRLGRKPHCESVKMSWVSMYFTVLMFCVHFFFFTNDRCEGYGEIVGRVCSVACLEKEVVSAQSQSTGRMLELNDWVKMDCSQGFTMFQWLYLGLV